MFFNGGPVMLLVALVSVVWLVAIILCLRKKLPYAKSVAVLGSFPLAFTILAATKAALNEHSAGTYGMRHGQVEPMAFYQGLLAASRSSLMILAMAGLSLLVFVVACFLPIGEELK